MTRKAKGVPFQMRSGNATPFKNMGSSYVQPTHSPIQNEGSPVKQIGTLIKKAVKYAPGVTKYVKGLFSKSDEMAETVKKVKNAKPKKVTVKPKTKTKKPTQKEIIAELEQKLAKKTELKLDKHGNIKKSSKEYKDIFKKGVESVPTTTVPAPKFPKLNKMYNITKGLATTTGVVYGADQIYNMATSGSDDESNTSVKDIGGYLDEPNKLITSEGDTLDLSKNVIKKGDY